MSARITFAYQRGTAIIETLMFLSVFVWLLSSGLSWTWQAGEQSLTKINRSRAEILQPLWHSEQGELRNTDHFAQAVEPILQPLRHWGEIDFATKTLRVLPANDNYIALATLENSWSPTAASELSRRPRHLTSFGQLQRTGLDSVLHWFGKLPIAREFAKSSFRFGWVNSDATLYELKCSEVSCDQ